MAEGIANTTLFSSLYDKSYDKIFFDEYKRKPEFFSRIGNVMTHNEHSIKKGSLAPFIRIEEKDQGDVINYIRPEEAFNKELTFRVFASGFQVTEEMREDDEHGIMGARMSAELGKALAYTREVEFADLFNDAFSASGDRTGWDDLTLCNDSHTVTATGGTIDNQSTSALSLTTLEAAIQHFRDLTNDAGHPIMLVPKVLLIPSALEWQAKELLLSPLKPYTTDNEINPIEDEGISYLVYPYLTSSTAWYLLAAPGDHDLNFIWRASPYFKESEDFDSGNKKHKVRARFQVGFFDWRGVYGSSGA